jgi:hypothetical protein
VLQDTTKAREISLRLFAKKSFSTPSACTAKASSRLWYDNYNMKPATKVGKVAAFSLAAALSLFVVTPPISAEPPPVTTPSLDTIELIPPISTVYQDQTDLIHNYESAWSLWDDAVRQESSAKTALADSVSKRDTALAESLKASKDLGELLSLSRHRAAASYVFSPSSQSSPLAAPSSNDAILSSMVREDSDNYDKLHGLATKAESDYIEAQRLLSDATQAHATALDTLALRKSHLDLAKDALLSFQRNIELAADGCPMSSPPGTLSPTAEIIGIYQLCLDSVLSAPSREAAGAIKYALAQLGAPYTKVARMQDGMFDCSSLVMRSYEASGALTVSRGGRGWAPTTWVIRQAPWAVTVSALDARPGDLLFPSPGHVSMLLAHGQMVHTSTLSKPARVQDAYRTTHVIKRILPWYLQDPASQVPNPWSTWSPPETLENPVAAPSDDPTADFIEPIVIDSLISPF